MTTNPDDNLTICDILAIEGDNLTIYNILVQEADLVIQEINRSIPVIKHWAGPWVLGVDTGIAWIVTAPVDDVRRVFEKSQWIWETINKPPGFNPDIRESHPLFLRRVIDWTLLGDADFADIFNREVRNICFYPCAYLLSRTAVLCWMFRAWRQKTALAAFNIRYADMLEQNPKTLKHLSDAQKYLINFTRNIYRKKLKGQGARMKGIDFYDRKFEWRIFESLSRNILSVFTGNFLDDYLAVARGDKNILYIPRNAARRLVKQDKSSTALKGDIEDVSEREVINLTVSIMELIESLTDPTEKQILSMHIEGYSSEEIAKELGIPDRSVRHKIRILKSF